MKEGIMTIIEVSMKKGIRSQNIQTIKTATTNIINTIQVNKKVTIKNQKRSRVKKNSELRPVDPHILGILRIT